MKQKIKHLLNIFAQYRKAKFANRLKRNKEMESKRVAARLLAVSRRQFNLGTNWYRNQV